MTQHSNVPSKAVTGKPRVSMRAASRPHEPVPIKDALIESGLIKQEDIVLKDTAVQDPESPPHPDTEAERKALIERTFRPKEPSKTRLLLPPPADPDNIPDAKGYTPYMHRLMATPGFDALVDILQHQRPMGSKRESDMIAAHIYPLASEIEGLAMTEDKQGNIFIDLGDNAAGVLWSCHTDTVHDNRQQGRQGVTITRNGYLQLTDRWDGCLGADDGVGVWIMIQMIRARIPGRYIFHFGEERGCIGSRHILAETPWHLEGMNFAIAFDRQGTEDVVTRQGGRICCSAAFVDSIVTMLPPGYRGHPGVWTDTAIYIDTIPECTNLSVGYRAQHSSNEVVYLPHLFALRDAMLKFDASKLVVGRDIQAQKDAEFAYHQEQQAQREQEERTRRQRTSTWSDHFQRSAGAANLQTGSTSSSSTRKKGMLPAYVEELPIAQASLIVRIASRAEFDELDVNAQDQVEAILGQFYLRRFNYLRKCLKLMGATHDDVYKDKTHKDESYDDQMLDNGFGGTDDRSPPKPRSMLELVRNYPNELADVLEDQYDVDEFWERILDNLGAYRG